MMQITVPGIYRYFDVAAYHADPCPAPSFTQSLAKLLLDRSPRHAMLEHPRLCPASEGDDEPAEKYDPAKAIGNAAHKLILSRGRDLAVYNYDSWRGEKRKDRDAAEADGLIPILEKHHRRSLVMVDEAFKHLAAAGFPDAFGTPGEVVIAWQEDGLWFRSLIDWIDQDLRVVWDFKTTGLSVAPHAIPKLMADAGWDLQAATQERGLDIIDPANAGRRKFRFVAQENAPPYAMSICELPESVMTMGRKKLAVAIDIWSRCMRSGEWPGYPSDVVFPQYPGWAESRWLEREVEHDERKRTHRSVRLTADGLMAG